MCLFPVAKPSWSGYHLCLILSQKEPAWRSFFSEITVNRSTNRLYFLSNCADGPQRSLTHGVRGFCLTRRSQAHYIGPRLGFKSAGTQGPLLNSKRSSCCYGDCKLCTFNSRDFPHAWIKQALVLLPRDQPDLYCCLLAVMPFLIHLPI